MITLARTAAFCACFAIAACSNATRWDDTNAVNLNNAGTGVAGAASDPASPAYFQQTVGDRVLFAVDQSSLTRENQLVLEAQANWLLANPDYSATIEGHADEQGTREYNLALGARRANAVREYLVARGVSGDRLGTVSFGKERPIEICSEESCYAQNRRAVTVLSAGAQG